jgi:hypothetical protein
MTNCSQIFTEEVCNQIIEIETPCPPSGAGDTLSGDITSGQTKVIDANLAETFLGASYIFSIYNITQNKYRFFQLSMTKVGSGTEETVYNKLGDALSLSVQTGVNGSNIEVTVHNNESFDLQYKAIRFKI